MRRNWAVREEIPEEAAAELKGYPELLRRLLYYRGIKIREAAEHFLNPSYERDLHDPFLMPDMEEAVRRIWRAIETGEQIGVFSDYDADGVPGAAVLTEFFHQVSFKHFEICIPNRQTEDFGLSEKVVRELAARGVSLIITIDNGISAAAETDLAISLGIDVIITDHHLPPPVVPRAFAILNPKYPVGRYPDEMLCGSGVVFKLIQALLRRGAHRVPAGWEKWLLDLVAVATISDMVPLVKENRALVYFGLKVIRQTRRLGLLSMFSVAGLKREMLTEEDIGYMLGPRINAASRMAHASEAYFLLTTSDPGEAGTLARHLEDHNKDRRRAIEKILTKVKKEFAPETAPAVIVSGGEEVTSGVLGLAATRLVEHFKRPVVLWARQGEAVKGSCRSDGSVGLVALMTRAGGEQLFAKFGGHEMAAGFTLPASRVSELAERLLAAYSELPKAAVVKELLLDGELSIEEVNEDTFRIVNELAPFGVGNPRPNFLFKNITIDGVRTFGNGGSHLELTFKNGKGELIPAVGFFNGNSFQEYNLASGTRINLAAAIEKNFFRNRSELRLKIADWRQSC